VPIETFHPVLRAALITGDAPEFLHSQLPNRPSHEDADPRPWSAPTKVAARYLGAYLERGLGADEPAELADLDPAADRDAAEEHRLAVEVLLAAADADAGAGDFEGALRWLSFVEQLNLVIPTAYVAHRDRWRRRLSPATPHEAAAARIDPSSVSASAALSDLQRRIGWLRELGGRVGDEMSEHLSSLDRGIDELIALSRRAGVLRGPFRR
jgi:hypothetical protein